ncbi:MAG: hypothetical protein WCO25_02665 [Candidatus Uhrbacteria bacterium]
MLADKPFLLVLDDLLRPHSTAESPLDCCRARGEFLGVSHSQMHRIQRGLVPLSAKMARRFASRIGRTQAERDQVCADLLPFVTNPCDDALRRVRMCLEAARLQSGATLKVGGRSKPPYDLML